jgi:hypothetical protein
MSDPRMALTVGPARIEASHVYVVKVLGKVLLKTGDRHRALQVYVKARRALDDHATEPARYLVRLWCDDREYFCDQDSFPQGWRDSGKSCRQLTGAVRPYPWERQLP